MSTCPNCGTEVDETPVPVEPPIGTWVRDRHGATHVRFRDRDGNVGWGPSDHGFYAFAKWEAMWRARGPLEIITYERYA